MGIEENEITDSFTRKSRRAISDESSSLGLESAYGSVRPSAKPEDWDEISRNAKDAKAEKTACELREECGS